MRSYYLAKALVDRGIEVEVITGHNENDKHETVDNIIVHYLHVPYDNAYGFGKRVLSFIQYVRNALALAKQIKHVDLTYAISVPLTVGIIAMRIKRTRGIPFLFEVGDLWPEAPVQMGFINNSVLKKILYALERRIYSSANAIVALSVAIKKDIESKVNGKKVFLIPNMADTRFFQKTSKDQGLIRKYGAQDKFVISYVGAIGEANGLDTFIECANASRKAGLSIKFLVCGEGAHRTRLEQLVKRINLQNISFLAFTNRDGVKEILNVSDASFISYKPVPVLETGSPNKYFDALAAGRLVIVNFGGWIKKEVEENKCGIFVDPFQPTDFIKKIRPFLEDPILLENYQYNARTLAEKSYSREELSSQFYRLIKEGGM